VRLTYFVVSRSWASSRLRTLLSIAGVALGVAVVTAIHVIDHDTIESQYRKQRGDFGRVDLELLPHERGREPAAVVERLQALDGVRHVGVWRQCIASLAVGEDDRGTVEVFGLAPLPDAVFGHYAVETGEDLAAGDRDAVLIGRELARSLALEPGARLRLARVRPTPRALCKEGKWIASDGEAAIDPAPVDVTVKGILAHARLGRRGLGQVVVGPFELAAHLAPNAPTMYQLDRTAGASRERLRQALEGEFEVVEARAALLGEGSDERAFRNGVKVLGCLALVLGMFVVFQTLSMSLVERLRQLGLLRCLGASRRAVAGVFLLDALATGVVGAVLGVGGGIALAWLLQGMDVSTLGRGKNVTVFEVPVGPVLWTAALGVLFTLAGAAFPLYKARNLPTLAVLHPHGLDEGGRGGGAWVLRGVNLFLFVMLVLVLPGAYLAMTPLVSEEGYETLIVLGQLGGMILLFGAILLLSPRIVQLLGRLTLRPLGGGLRLPAFLVDKEIQRRPGRFAASVCGLSIVLVALVGQGSLTLALRGEAQQFAGLAMHERMFLRCGPMPPERAAALRAVPGVGAVTAHEGSAQVPFALRGVAPDALAAVGLDATAIARYAERRCLVISSRLANMWPHKRPGDAILLHPDGGPIPYEILAIDDRVGFFPDERAWAVTAPRWLQHDYCAGAACVETLSVRLDPEATADVVLARIREHEPGVHWAKTGADMLAYHLRDVDGDFRIFDVLLALILALAGVGLLNAMTIAALGRAREIGVLRALGMGRGALRATFLIEGALVAVLATLLAMGLGLPLGRLLVSGLNRVSGLQAPFVAPWIAIASVPALALLVAVLAALLPGARAVRQDPAAAVRYE
jgi:putative ABC transport system permease protein